MGIVVGQRSARTILGKSGIPGVRYCINPYLGCEHACAYCYADFMARYSGHAEPWGSFVDVKVNALEVLGRELLRARQKGGKNLRVMLSSVTDPYQPLEARWKLTRGCIEMLLAHGFGVDILTKSPLVLRDLDLFEAASPGQVEVGMTVTTDDDSIRAAFEPHAPTIAARIHALKTLHERGIKTYVFVGPILPMNPVELAAMLAGNVDSALVDSMNYPGKSAAIYRKLGLQDWLDKAKMADAGLKIKEGLRRGAAGQIDICY